MDPDSDSLKRHMELCPWCRQAVRSGSFRSAASVAEKLKALAQNTTVPTPAPGMIFFLNPALGTWGRDGRYVTPPTVLILSEPDRDELTVAQVSGAYVFNGPGDIPLGSGLQGFAESWNTYRIHCGDLLMLSANAGDASAEAVTHAMAEVVDKARPEPGSVTWFYQELERETGRFISDRSCNLSKAANSPLHIQSENIKHHLENAGFNFAASIPANASPETILLMSDPPEELLPLAAAGGGSENKVDLSAIVFHLADGNIREIVTMPVTISFSEQANGLYRITGRLAAPLPETMQGAELQWLVRIDTADGLQQPVPGMSGSSGMMFWAAFNLPASGTVRPGDIKIRISALEPL